MLVVKEAAELIALHSNARTWQRYEDGTRNIPDEIGESIYALIQRRIDIIAELTEQQCQLEDGETLKLRYYHSFDEWRADHPGVSKINWRIHQSAVAYIFSESGNVELE